MAILKVWSEGWGVFALPEGHAVPALAVLAAILAATLAVLSTYVVYSLYFHPLADYPGPLLARLTRAYDAYHAFKGDKHILIYRLHQKYGPIVRYSPNAISINTPAALKAIYQKKYANVQKSVFYECFRATPDAVSMFLATDRMQHARKRRVMAQAFSDQALRDLERYVQEHIQSLVDRIGESIPKAGSSDSWSDALDMQQLSNHFVFDVMGEIVFGSSLGTQGKHPENRRAIKLLTNAARRNYVAGAMPSLITTRLERYLPGLRKTYLDRLAYFAFGKSRVMARIKEHSTGGDAGRKDIFNFLLSAKDPVTGEGFSMPELLMEGNTLIVAGSDTTSTTMGAILFYLLSNPSTLTKLQSEIRSKFTRREEICSGSAMRSCVYLQACIDEALRMTPALAGVLPRQTLNGGLHIPEMDLFLPPGIDVGVSAYSIHHHADFVKDPFKYDPARWLDKDRAEEREVLKTVFTPFSLGTRSCVAKSLVYMELSAAIARLVFEFDMRMAPQQPLSADIVGDLRRGRRVAGEYHIRDWFLGRNEGPFAEVRWRENTKDS